MAINQADQYLLCVDDDPDDCSLLKEAIERHTNSIAIVFIHSGNEVVDFLNNAISNNKLPGLIILDVNMPGMDGKNTLLAIEKVLPEYIPILFLTTTPRDVDIIFGERHKAALLAKPTDIKGYDDLAKTILDLFIGGK
jgi:two-component system, response regulator